MTEDQDQYGNPKRRRGRPPGKVPPKMIRFYIRGIPPDNWRRFRRLAARHEYTLNALALAIIEQAVDFADEEQAREQAAAKIP